MAEALADGVQDVEQLVLQLVAVEPFPDQVRLFDRELGVVGRLDRDLQLGDRPLPGSEHRQIVEVLLLHLLGQFEVGEGVALFGRMQD